MTKIISRTFCDICGKDMAECNIDENKTHKDIATMDINIDHCIHVTQNTFIDKDHGNIKINSIHLDICSKCFVAFSMMLKNPVKYLYPALPEVPENYYNEEFYDIVEGEDYNRMEYKSLVNLGFSDHDCCSYYACPKCKKEVGSSYGIDNYIKKVYIKRKTSGEFDKIFNCPNCGYKCRLISM